MVLESIKQGLSQTQLYIPPVEKQKERFLYTELSVYPISIFPYRLQSMRGVAINSGKARAAVQNHL